jgi:hypothetical protein
MPFPFSLSRRSGNHTELNNEYTGNSIKIFLIGVSRTDLK